MTSVYQIKNLVTGNFYIGCSSFFNTRIEAHFKSLESKRHISKRMQEDYDSHGANSFVVGILKSFTNRQIALRNEKSKILNKRPAYNKAHKKNNVIRVRENKMNIWQACKRHGAVAAIARKAKVKREIIREAIYTGWCEKRVKNAIDNYFIKNSFKYQRLIQK